MAPVYPKTAPAQGCARAVSCASMDHPASLLLPRAHTLDIGERLGAFASQGFARLGPVLSAEAAAALCTAADELMQHHHPGLFYQHDAPTGRYQDLDFGSGWVGPSHRYRKLERLEQVPIFAAWIGNALFERIAREALGDDVRLYRSVLWNKAPNVGMAVPWHQDDGRFWGLDRPPMLQVWTALDDASPAAGCLQVVPGSHKGGLATPEGGTVTEACLRAQDAEHSAVSLPAARGESILVHNHLWHRTGRNHTDRPRRAISVSFLSADTRCRRSRRTPRRFAPAFGTKP